MPSVCRPFFYAEGLCCLPYATLSSMPKSYAAFRLPFSLLCRKAMPAFRLPLSLLCRKAMPAFRLPLSLLCRRAMPAFRLPLSLLCRRAMPTVIRHVAKQASLPPPSPQHRLSSHIRCSGINGPKAACEAHPVHTVFPLLQSQQRS